MNVLFTDEQLTEMESSAHKQVVEDDWAVVEWIYDLIKEVRHYKSKVEEMQAAMKEVDEIIDSFYEHFRIREKYKPMADEVKMIHKIILQTLKGVETN